MLLIDVNRSCSVVCSFVSCQSVSEAAWEKRLYLRELAEIGKWIAKSLSHKEAKSTYEKIAKMQRTYKQFEDELWTLLTKLKQELITTEFDVRTLILRSLLISIFDSFNLYMLYDV